MKKICLLFMILCLASTVQSAENRVEYRVDNALFEGIFISPAPGAPLVVMIHDWDGLGEYEIRRAHMLADQGYAVFAADMFGKGIRPEEISERRRLTGELYQDRERMRRLLQGALAAAAGQGGDLENAVAMGYCFGGTVVLELARSGEDLKGFVSFHGGLATPPGQDYAQTSGSLLILHGSADTAVTMTEFAKLADALEQHGVAHEMITYGGAPHAFSVFGTNRYREDADRKSWQRFLDYLDQTLTGR
ncbi:MAG: dienelactone hydrolase family protein [Desulfotignum sp.]